jgi:hypothetical protein
VLQEYIEVVRLGEEQLGRVDKAIAECAQRIRHVPAYARQHHLQRVMHPLDHLAQCRDHHLVSFAFASAYQCPLIATQPMMMQMVGAFAEFERAMIRERTSAGLAAARAQGRIGGRRKKLDTAKRREVASGHRIGIHECWESPSRVGLSVGWYNSSDGFSATSQISLTGARSGLIINRRAFARLYLVCRPYLIEKPR